MQGGDEGCSAITRSDATLVGRLSTTHTERCIQEGKTLAITTAIQLFEECHMSARVGF